MKTLPRSLLGAATTWLVCASPAQADLFVSGDANIADPLIGQFGGVPGINTGNQQFFQNILGSGSNVAVLASETDNGSECVVAVHWFYYNDLADIGKNATLIFTPINSLAGYDLLVVPFPEFAFSPAEITVLNNFLSEGNSVFFLGDNNAPDLSASNAAINSDLAALGSSMRIVPEAIDNNWHIATGSQIATDPFTAGVSELGYDSTSIVTGGTDLFFATDGQPFIAYSAVPEPGSAPLFGAVLLGAIGLGGKFRK